MFKERVDMMKVMIMGASGTPYAHGAFIFDLFFDNAYPSGPPSNLTWFLIFILYRMLTYNDWELGN